MKASKKPSKKKTVANRLSKKLLYLFILLLAIPVTILFLGQSQSLSQHAQTIPSPATLGPCPSSSSCSSSSSSSIAISNAPCNGPAMSNHGRRERQGFLQVFLEFFLELLKAIFGIGTSGAAPTTAVPTPAPVAPTSPPISSTPCPPSSSSSSSSSVVATSSSSSSTASAPNEGSCVAPAGMTALIDADPSDEQKPWKRTPGQQKTTIYEVAQTVTPEFKTDMQYGATQWSKSPCLDVKVVDSCPAGGNCYLWTAPSASCGDDGNTDAKESGNFTVSGGTVCVITGKTAPENKNITVHEMGHTVGLVHRLTTHVLMNTATYSDVFDPDQTDFKNILFLYGSQK